jgi:hypothetical protein
MVAGRLAPQFIIRQTNKKDGSWAGWRWAVGKLGIRRQREREEGGSWCLVAGEFLEVQRGKRWKTEGLKKAVAVHAGEGGGLSI